MNPVVVVCYMRKEKIGGELSVTLGLCSWVVIPFQSTNPMKATMCDASRAQLWGVDYSLFIYFYLFFFSVLRTKASVWYISDSSISNQHTSSAFTVPVWGIIT